jgi:hypothetical protein
MMTLEVLRDTYAVCRLEKLPDVDLGAEMMALTVTPHEISLVCPQQKAPDGAVVECGWRVMRVAGMLDFSLVGILAKIAGILADAGISIFVISTYNTDYILVKENALPHAMAALETEGYAIAVS